MSVFLLAVVVLAGGLMAGLARLGEVAVTRAKARTAADAAALAGVADGRAAADAVAVENGGEVVEFAEDGPEVQVVVRVGATAATARARREALPRPEAGPGQRYDPPGRR